MSKIVFDSDGLIKLAKSGILQSVLDCFQSFISREVFAEVVVEGKKLEFEDAFIVGGLIEKAKLKVKKHSTNKGAALLLKNRFGLGPGEISALHLFYNIKAKAIITDDQSFLRVLHEGRIPFVVPADLIYRAYILKKINKADALEALIKIRHLIRDDVFNKIERKIVEGKK